MAGASFVVRGAMGPAVRQDEAATVERAYDSIDVYVAIAPDCPICQAMATSLRELGEWYGRRGVGFHVVIPASVSDTDAVVRFMRQYRLPFDVRFDTENLLIQRFGLGVTPECVVVDRRRTVVYRGRINNLFPSLGRRRRVITEHDLRNVLQAMLDGKPTPPSTTEAVGCVIEYLPRR